MRWYVDADVAMAEVTSSLSSCIDSIERRICWRAAVCWRRRRVAADSDALRERLRALFAGCVSRSRLVACVILEGRHRNDAQSTFLLHETWFWLT
jgi:hypothetical protein